MIAIGVIVLVILFVLWRGKVRKNNTEDTKPKQEYVQGVIHIDEENQAHMIWEDGIDEIVECKEGPNWIIPQDYDGSAIILGVNLYFNIEENAWSLSYDRNERMLGAVEGLRILKENKA